VRDEVPYGDLKNVEERGNISLTPSQYVKINLLHPPNPKGGVNGASSNRKRDETRKDVNIHCLVYI